MGTSCLRESWPQGSTGVQRYGCTHSKVGSSKSLVLKSFSGEVTHWDSSASLPLTLGCACTSYTPTFPPPTMRGVHPLRVHIREHEGGPEIYRS